MLSDRKQHSSTSLPGLNDNNTCWSLWAWCAQTQTFPAGWYKTVCEECGVITDRVERVMFGVVCVRTRQSALDARINTCMKFYFWRRERLGLGSPGWCLPPSRHADDPAVFHIVRDWAPQLSACPLLFRSAAILWMRQGEEQGEWGGVGPGGGNERTRGREG